MALLKNKAEMDIEIPVAARASNLSRAQVKEILNELHVHYPMVKFNSTYLQTTGDLDQKTSLRGLAKTDFFTQEIDQLQLNGKCRISIHSAKDLPEELAGGLSIAAITKGLDPADSLVLREGESFSNLPENFIIATSSLRREEAVKSLYPKLKFKDLRGDIIQRLALLNEGKADGIVVAEAALIRLGLTGLNRVKLPGETTELQGQLAIVIRNDDLEMEKMFSCLDARKKDTLPRS
ncbi:MAG: hydroxymethylbilane synthase [Chlamydiales bacterium]|jgi:hydroxymethylbilane synthase